MRLGGRPKTRVSFVQALHFDFMILIIDHGVPFPPVRKNDRESLEQLPDLILKLTEEVKELKISNLELMENMRYNEGGASLEGLPVKLSTTPDISPLVGRSAAQPCVYWNEPHADRVLFLPQGSDSPYQSFVGKRWTQSRIAALLPESHLLRGLISQFVSLTFSSSKENSRVAYKLLWSSMASASRLCTASWIHRCFSTGL